MSQPQTPEGCAAHGCPLFGTMKTETNGGGSWWCCCHVAKEPGATQAITAALNADALLPICKATLDIRRFAGTDEWETVYRGIQGLLIRADRKDLLMGDIDRAKDRSHRSIRTWLLRLESCLTGATQEIGKQKRFPTTVPTGAVKGPTHISGSLPYSDKDAA